METKTNKTYSVNTQSYVVALSGASTDISTGINIESFRLDFQCQLDAVFIEVDTNEAPTGENIICDVNFEGVSIFDEKPTILANESESKRIRAFTKSTFKEGDELSFDIDHVGLGDAGKRLKIHLIVSL